MHTQHTPASSTPRIEALRKKHQMISKKLETVQSRPFKSDTQITELKREKLKLKEEIEGIRQAS